MSKVAAWTIAACPTLLPSLAHLSLVCTCGEAKLADWFPAGVRIWLVTFCCIAALIDEQQAQL